MGPIPACYRCENTLSHPHRTLILPVLLQRFSRLQGCLVRVRVRVRLRVTLRGLGIPIGLGLGENFKWPIRGLFVTERRYRQSNAGLGLVLEEVFVFDSGVGVGVRVRLSV